MATAGIVLSSWVCVCVCVILEKCGPDDMYCTGNNHKIHFEHFRRYLYSISVCMSVCGHILSIVSQLCKVQSQNFTGLDQNEGRLQRWAWSKHGGWKLELQNRESCHRDSVETMDVIKNLDTVSLAGLCSFPWKLLSGTLPGFENIPIFIDFRTLLLHHVAHRANALETLLLHLCVIWVESVTSSLALC